MAKFFPVQWFTARCGLQNRHSKGLTAKFVFLNELAPEGVRGLLVSDLYIQYSRLSETKMPNCNLMGINGLGGFGA